MPIITWLLFIHFLRCMCNPSSELWTHSKCSNFYYLLVLFLETFTSNFKKSYQQILQKHPPFPKCTNATCRNGITPFLPLWVWKGFFHCDANPPKSHYHLPFSFFTKCDFQTSFFKNLQKNSFSLNFCHGNTSCRLSKPFCFEK